MNTSERFYKRLIAALSIFVFLLVLLLSRLPRAEHVPAFVPFLPKLNALLNAATTIILIISFNQIRKKQIAKHKKLNLWAVGLSTVFLLSYVTFHAFGVETLYGDTNHDHLVDASEKAAAGTWRPVYLTLLSTHIVLAAIVLPLVLLSLYRGLTNQVELHRKITKWSFPIWLYVTVSGVLVYLMISPYYNF